MGNLHKNQVFGFGSNEDSQLGLVTKENIVKIPTQLNEPKDVIVRQISAGGSHIAMLVEKSDRRRAVYTCGNGYSGQLGHGFLDSFSTPKRVDALMNKKIRKVACGSNHTLALTYDGEVYSWGRGQDGQLGHGNLSQSLTPRKIEAISKAGIIDIAAGDTHSAAISSTGEVYTWGGGLSNFLGHKQNNKRPIPHIIPNFENIDAVKIACGAQHTVLLTSKGVVYSWGRGSDGQLGHGDFKFQPSPQKIELLDKKPVSDISCGRQYTTIVTMDGKLYTFGSNDCGQLGHSELGTMNKPKLVKDFSAFHIVSVSCGNSHTLALTIEGYVFGFGSGEQGQLGIGKNQGNQKPKLVSKLKNTLIRQVECGNDFSFVLSGGPIHNPFFVPEDTEIPETAIYEDRQNAEKLRLEKLYRISTNKLNYIDLSFDEEYETSSDDYTTSSSSGEEGENKNEKKDNKEIKKEEKKDDKTNTNNKIDLGSESGSEDSDDEPPDHFVCPITFEVMFDPVLASDGYSYEREAIEDWFSKKDTSPMTGANITSKVLVPNNSLKEQIMSSKWADEFD
ncbi:regulator of chromosome condensation [Anaeramoeba flamelloides]|uniref:Regulator of chromosome condensation n=1 Tax=Anaeramoeba flamelloides TaxID=1746091 RepID=A0AAV7Z311_9EUKA|nr:regulator of chromosome condensation [Anaeramoeba flamelloides]